MSLFTAEDITKLAAAMDISNEDMLGKISSHSKAAGIPTETVSSQDSSNTPSSDGASETKKPQAEASSMQFFLAQPPRLPYFSGEMGKGECRFDVWWTEVDKLQEDTNIPPKDVERAVRKSLQGKAARLAKRLGSAAELSVLLKKLEGRFGSTATSPQVIRDFYAARQGDGEDVASWACRLEDLIERAVEAKRVDDSETNKLLREQFWAGLRPELSAGNEYKFDSLPDFDDLEEAFRGIEKHLHPQETHKDTTPGKSRGSTAATAKMTQVQENKDGDLRQMIGQLSERMNSLQGEMKQMKETFTSSQHSDKKRYCYVCGDPNHLANACPNRTGKSDGKGNGGTAGRGGNNHLNR